MSEQSAARQHGLLAAIFDVDGVLVASPHERAWREALAGYADPARFTTEFYQANVAGKRRMDGALATLERLGVPNAAARVPEYAATKQALIDRLIAEGDFEAFPDAVRLAVAVQAAGLKLALASSSKNVGATLRQTIWKSAPAPNPRLASLARWRHPPTNSHPGPAPASIRSAAG